MGEGDVSDDIVPVRRADRDDVATALHLLERLRLTPQDLLEGLAARTVPTFEELVPTVVEAIPEGSRAGYRGYLRRFVAVHGSRRLDEVDAEDVVGFLALVRETAEVRVSSTGGNAAARGAHCALSWLFRYAVDHGLIGARQNVMAQVRRPRAGQGKRHGLDPSLVAEILAVARSTGHDPSLDALILRLHLETAARTGGALALRLCDLDADRSLVRLRQKGASLRWQPVTPTLMRHLSAHARERGAREPGDRVLRRRDGTPLHRQHYYNLWARIGTRVETVKVRGISTHWLRHTTLTWVERNFGYAVARAYAGHVVPASSTHGITQVYVKAGVPEIATALQAMTGEAHPLALTPLLEPAPPAADAVAGAAVGTPDPADPGGFGTSAATGRAATAGVVGRAGDEVLVERIRRLLDEAALAGRRRPGWAVLARATGVSQVRVKVALARIAGGGPSEELVGRVRGLLEDAARAGRRRPGSASIADAIGVSKFQVDLALAEIRGVAEPVSVGDRDELVEQVRRLRDEAGRMGSGRRPGVVSLARATGAPPWRITLALAEVRGMGPDAADQDGDAGVNRGREELRDRVRGLLEQAGRAGRRPPGVITLASATGVSRWRVEMALAELRGIAKRPAGTGAQGRVAMAD